MIVCSGVSFNSLTNRSGLSQIGAKARLSALGPMKLVNSLRTVHVDVPWVGGQVLDKAELCYTNTPRVQCVYRIIATPTPLATPPPAFVGCEGRQEEGVSIGKK